MYGNYYNPYTGYPNGNYYSPSNSKQEIVKVNGRNGAEAYQMMPNSSALLLDETAPIVWLVQTDGAGYKTLSAFDLTPHKEVNTSNALKSLDDRLTKIEELISRGMKHGNESNNRAAQQSFSNANSSKK